MNRHERTVTLHDGREVSNYSEDYRHECEARSVINMDGFGARQRHLQGVEQRRGKAERDRLQATISALLLHRDATRILAMQTLHERREHLDLIEWDRGSYARREVEDEVRRLWEKRRAA